jgi:hypothetical protein
MKGTYHHHSPSETRSVWGTNKRDDDDAWPSAELERHLNSTEKASQSEYERHLKFPLSTQTNKREERQPTLNDLTIVSIENPQSPLAQRYDAPIIFLPDTLLTFASVTDVYGQKMRCLNSDQNHPPSALCAFRLTWFRQAKTDHPNFQTPPGAPQGKPFLPEPKLHQYLRP